VCAPHTLSCVAQDEFYNRYLVRNNLFDPVIVAFLANGSRYNLLNRCAAAPVCASSIRFCLMSCQFKAGKPLKAQTHLEETGKTCGSVPPVMVLVETLNPKP